jgi:hypothetical protein
MKLRNSALFVAPLFVVLSLGLRKVIVSDGQPAVVIRPPQLGARAHSPIGGQHYLKGTAETDKHRISNIEQGISNDEVAC